MSSTIKLVMCSGAWPHLDGSLATRTWCMVRCVMELPLLCTSQLLPILILVTKTLSPYKQCNVIITLYVHLRSLLESYSAT